MKPYHSARQKYQSKLSKIFLNKYKRIESKQKEFFNQSKETYIDKLTGLVFEMKDLAKKDLLQSHKINFQNTKQKMYAIAISMNDKNIVPIFMTITLPSPYHPFRANGTSNPQYLFKDLEIENALNASYQKLNEFHRQISKRVLKIDKPSKFITVFEPHKTYVPHSHSLIFVSRDKVEHTVNYLQKTLGDFTKQYDIKVMEDSFGGVNYLLKYIDKGITKELLGWRWSLKQGARIIRTSNFKLLSLQNYKKVYYRLPQAEKEEWIAKARKNKTNLYYEISKSGVVEVEREHKKEYKYNKKIIGEISYKEETDILETKINKYLKDLEDPKISDMSKVFMSLALNECIDTLKAYHINNKLIKWKIKYKGELIYDKELVVCIIKE